MAGRRIAVFGAGLIGIWLGGRLSRHADVTLIGRPAMLDPLRGGLRLTDVDGLDLQVAASSLRLATGPEALADADLVLVTVKCQGTAEAAAAIAAHAPATAPLLSFQNGVSNADILAVPLPGRAILAGMVPYNIAARAPGQLHRGTGGGLVVADNAALQTFENIFAESGIPLTKSDNILGVQWGKLLINLNNSINALSGLTLMEQLRQRDYRRAWALAMAEGLQMVRAAKITLVDPLPVSLSLLPYLMRLPNSLYGKAMARSGGGKARVDPHARSSMADDLARGRTTEVDWLNGEVVRLAERLGKKAPVNARLVELVRAAEQGAKPWEAAALLENLKAARRG